MTIDVRADENCFIFLRELFYFFMAQVLFLGKK
jgi:hypothetical protein